MTITGCYRHLATGLTITWDVFESDIADYTGELPEVFNYNMGCI